MLKVGRKRKRKELRKKERQRAHELDLSSRFSASHHSAYLCLKTSYSSPRHLRSPLQIDQMRTWGMISLKKVIARDSCWAALPPFMYKHIFQVKRTFDILATKRDKAIRSNTLKYVRNFGYLSNLQLMTIETKLWKKNANRKGVTTVLNAIKITLIINVLI